MRSNLLPACASPTSLPPSAACPQPPVCLQHRRAHHLHQPGWQRLPHHSGQHTVRQLHQVGKGLCTAAGCSPWGGLWARQVAAADSLTARPGCFACPGCRDNILTVFGSKAADAVEPLQVEAEAEGGDEAEEGLEQGVSVSGWVSKATAPSGRSAGDRQFFFLNGRPVDLPKAVKLLNETYRSLSSPAAASSKPMAVVDFRCACVWGGGHGRGATAAAHPLTQLSKAATLPCVLPACPPACLQAAQGQLRCQRHPRQTQGQPACPPA